ncbi:hypothetical protein CWI37_0351p0010, partial [Hamiltosporidium tvaerminnensis]
MAVQYIFLIVYHIFATLNRTDSIISNETDEKNCQSNGEIISSMIPFIILNDASKIADKPNMNLNYDQIDSLASPASSSLYYSQINHQTSSVHSSHSIHNEFDGFIELANKNQNAEANVTEADSILYHPEFFIPDSTHLDEDILRDVLPVT